MNNFLIISLASVKSSATPRNSSSINDDKRDRSRDDDERKEERKSPTAEATNWIWTLPIGFFAIFLAQIISCRCKGKSQRKQIILPCIPDVPERVQDEFL